MEMLSNLWFPKMDIEYSFSLVSNGSNDGASRPDMKARLPHIVPRNSSEPLRPSVEDYGVNLTRSKTLPPDKRSLSLVSNDSNDGASRPDMEDYGVEPESSEIERPDMLTQAYWSLKKFLGF